MQTHGERIFLYFEPSKSGVPEECWIKESEIIEIYFPYWKQEMEKLGKHDEISLENCIDDWVTCNWAVEQR